MNIVSTLSEFMCRSVEFLTWGFGILYEEYLDSVVRRIFDSTKEFYMRRVISAYALDCSSVFKIDKILVQDRSVCTRPSVCTYTRDLLIASLAPFSDYICLVSHQIEWPMSGNDGKIDCKTKNEDAAYDTILVTHIENNPKDTV